MTNKTIGVNEDFVIGNIRGKESVYIQNTPEQISAFIVKNQLETVIISDILDVKLIETLSGFLTYCSDQQYLASTLLPVLVPMQQGQVEPPEIVPYTI